MASAASTAAENRKIRQEALREQLQSRGLLQHVFVLLEKLQNFDEELDSIEVQRISKVIDTQMRLINKYLPDLKASEIDVTVNDRTLSERERIERLSQLIGFRDSSADRPSPTH